MEPIFLAIYSCDLYKYDQIELKEGKLNHLYGFYPFSKFKNNTQGKRKLKSLDCAFVHYLIKELQICAYYRQCFMKNVKIDRGPDILLLKPTKKNLIDYNWNERVYNLVREKCELDHALSWMSTLGGAFSALGDYFENCADTAGKISIHQLRLAFKLGDPNIASRCRLYLSLSLIQKKKFKTAAQIIRNEYNLSKTQIVNEQVRLVKMCLGIWSKLQYEHGLYRNNRRIKRVRKKPSFE